MTTLDNSDHQLPTKAQTARFIWPLGILATWFIAIFALASGGFFVAEPGNLIVGIMFAALTPPLVFATAYFFSAPLRSWVASLDMALVTGIQTWRVIGATFLILWGLGQLPAAFALPAGIGDVAVGIFALWVTLSVATRAPQWRQRARQLIIVGMVDFAVAIATGILSDPGRILGFEGAPSGQIIQIIPLVLVPTFLVPIFMIAHFIAFIKLTTEH